MPNKKSKVENILDDKYGTFKNLFLSDFNKRFCWDCSISKISNSLIVGDHTRFGFEDLDDQRVKELQKITSLKKMTQNSKTMINISTQLLGTDIAIEKTSDLITYLEILNWCHSRWVHNDYNQPTTMDALTILKESSQGKNFPCIAYATLFTQVATAHGLPVRMVFGQGSKELGYEFGHAMAEGWSNTYQKWILFDPDNNIIYFDKKKKVPLNALEVQIIANGKKKIPKNLLIISPSGSIKDFPGGENPVFYFEKLSFASHNKLFQQVDDRTLDIKYNSLRWRDIGFERSSLHKKKLMIDIHSIASNYSNDLSKIYFTLNQSFVMPTIDLPFFSRAFNDSRPQKILFVLKNSMPWFSHYLITINNQTYKIVDDCFEFNIDGRKQNRYNVSVTPINTKGHSGISSSVSLTLKRTKLLNKYPAEQFVQIVEHLGDLYFENDLLNDASKLFCKAYEMANGAKSVKSIVDRLKRKIRETSKI